MFGISNMNTQIVVGIFILALMLDGQVFAQGHLQHQNHENGQQLHKSIYEASRAEPRAGNQCGKATAVSKYLWIYVNQTILEAFCFIF